MAVKDYLFLTIPVFHLCSWYEKLQKNEFFSKIYSGIYVKICGYKYISYYLFKNCSFQID